MFDGQTQLVGVMGWPIAHSLSPVMHNAAFDALGLNWRYVALPVHPSQLSVAIEGLKALGFRGSNVTVPHKEAVIPSLDEVPSRVRRFGAVNTLVIHREEGGRCTVHGENTDVQGFVHALRGGGFDPQGRRVLVVGAGGGARGAVYGLCGAGAAEVVVLNRTPGRAAALVDDLSTHAPGTALRSGALTADVLERCANEADLLVNATTRGMWPHDGVSIWPDDRCLPSHLAVCDMVYRPLETKLLRQARAAGAWPIDGLGMLLGQGALSFQMWTGQWPPEDVMRAACKAVLVQEGSR
ncbi:MAG: shikimate dehydrogenase [Anaerolineae bacterium]|nr:shikimate dehydrogenase [Anaerolineae bacterium]